MKGIILTITGFIMVIILIIGIVEFSLNPILRSKLGNFFRWPYKPRKEVSLRQIGTSAVYVIKAIVSVLIIVGYVICALLMATYLLVEHKEKGVKRK